MQWYKHILLLSCLLIFTIQQAVAYGNYSYGDELVLKSDKAFAKIGVYDDQDESHLPVYLFAVIVRSLNKPLSYPESSKLVIKFSNDSVIEVDSFGLGIQEWDMTYGVERADDGIEYTGRNYDPYYRPWIYDVKPPMRIFYTGRNYRLEDTDLQKLLMWRIVKIQVELSDGKWNYFKIGKRQGKKILNQLQDSWRNLD